MSSVSVSFEDAREILKRENEEFARIDKKHRELDERIAHLEEQRFLSPEEEVEEKQLKKDKLRLKDLMAEMIEQYQASHKTT